MELAGALLSEGSLTVAQIAARVGYDAPEAFSRAFKREFGQAPAEWRSARNVA
jgi:AraC-like DNA-binding protein